MRSMENVTRRNAVINIKIRDKLKVQSVEEIMKTRRLQWNMKRKFYPGPGFEPEPLAFRANALTN